MIIVLHYSNYIKKKKKKKIPLLQLRKIKDKKTNFLSSFKQDILFNYTLFVHRK